MSGSNGILGIVCDIVAFDVQDHSLFGWMSLGQYYHCIDK